MRCDKLRRDFAAFCGESTEYVEPPVRAGSRELVFTALVSKEGVNFRAKGVTWIEFGRYSDLRSAFDRLCEVVRFQADKEPFTVTLKIEPVNRAAQVDAASGGVTRHEKE
jgi:hypothetical protein